MQLLDAYELSTATGAQTQNRVAFDWMCLDSSSLKFLVAGFSLYKFCMLMAHSGIDKKKTMR